MNIKQDREKMLRSKMKRFVQGECGNYFRNRMSKTKRRERERKIKQTNNKEK